MPNPSTDHLLCRWPRSQVLALVAWLVLAGILDGDELVDSDFGQASESIMAINGKPSPMVSGRRPRGWREDSSGWCQLRAKTGTVGDEGRTLLRVTTEEIASGRLQICLFPLPPCADAEAIYHLVGEIRNHDAGVAHAIFAWHVEDLDYSGCTDLGHGAYAYAFSGPRTVLILSSDNSYRGGLRVPDRPALTARDLWGNPLPAGAPFIGQILYLESTVPVAQTLEFLASPVYNP
jgi:hypothetical protein